MALKDLVIRTVDVEVPTANGPLPLTVRGLGIGAILALLRAHSAALEAFYAKAVAGEINADSVGDVIMEAMEHSSALVAEIIAMGCGEPDEAGKVAMLPVSAQVELLESIALLTFAAEGGAKKLMETVIRAMAGFNTLALPSG